MRLLQEAAWPWADTWPIARLVVPSLNFRQARSSSYKLEQDGGIILRCEIVRSSIHERPGYSHRKARGNSSSSPATRFMPS